MDYMPFIKGTYRNNAFNFSEFEESEDHEKGFKTYYDAEIKPLVNRFEEERLAILDEVAKRVRTVLALVVLAFPAGWWIFGGVEGFLSGIFAIIAVLQFNNDVRKWVFQPSRRYQDKIKDEVFSGILKFYGGFQFNASCPTSIEKWSHTGMIPQYKVEVSEDHIQGEYQDVALELFQCSLITPKTDKDGKRYYITEFSGLVITLKFEKNFQGKTILANDKGKVFNFVQGMAKNEERVELESPEFEELYEVYSTDQIGARKILTPAFMEKLTKLTRDVRDDLPPLIETLSKLSKKLPGRPPLCHFEGNEMFVMLPYLGDAFEPMGLDKPKDFVQDSKKLLREIKDICDIIDVLKSSSD